MRGFFISGGMEMQLNVLDPDTLEEARRNPGTFPGLVVRALDIARILTICPTR